MVSRNAEKAFRDGLRKRLEGVNKDSVAKNFSLYEKRISEKFSVSVAEISTWAKDFYIGFSGKKPLAECVSLAYELEEKSRNFAIDVVSKDEECFPVELAKRIEAEFFNGVEKMSLADASEFFFKSSASKEIQGKRIRTKDDMFDRLLHCAFAYALDEKEFDGNVCYRLEYKYFYHNPNSSYALTFNETDCDGIKAILKKGLSAQDFHRLLNAYLYEWDAYCALKPKASKKG